MIGKGVFLLLEGKREKERLSIFIDRVHWKENEMFHVYFLTKFTISLHKCSDVRTICLCCGQAHANWTNLKLHTGK